MANLAALLKMSLGKVNIVIVGVPEITNITDSNDKPYYLAKLAEEVNVRCSVDPAIESYPTDEVYIREEDLMKDGWVAVDEKKPELGVYYPDWVVDFSKGQGIAILQSETIKKWGKNNRATSREKQRTELNAKIKEMIASKKK